MDYSSIKEILRNKLDDYRYHHSLCVAEEAMRLARLYGADQEELYLAGLLHDITKCSSEEEHLKFFDEFDIILSDIEKNSKKLWHAISGAAYAKNILKVDSVEIISAIRFHTTAKSNMTLTEKILYLADFTSEDRSYKDVDVMRQLVNSSLDESMLYALHYTIGELLDKKVAIHPDTMDAYNEIVLKMNRGEIN